MVSGKRVVPFDQLRITDVDAVGGKNASLGEMIGGLAHAGIRVPGGFATTAAAFREFLAHERLDERIRDRLASLDVDDPAGAHAPPDFQPAVARNVYEQARGNQSALFCYPDGGESNACVAVAGTTATLLGSKTPERG